MSFQVAHLIGPVCMGLVRPREGRAHQPRAGALGKPKRAQFHVCASGGCTRIGVEGCEGTGSDSENNSPPPGGESALRPPPGPREESLKTIIPHNALLGPCLALY